MSQQITISETKQKVANMLVKCANVLDNIGDLKMADELTFLANELIQNTVAQDDDSSQVTERNAQTRPMRETQAATNPFISTNSAQFMQELQNRMVHDQNGNLIYQPQEITWTKDKSWEAQLAEKRAERQDAPRNFEAAGEEEIMRRRHEAMLREERRHNNGKVVEATEEDELARQILAAREAVEAFARMKGEPDDRQQQRFDSAVQFLKQYDPYYCPIELDFGI